MKTSFLPYSFAAHHVWPGLYLLVPIHLTLGVHGLLALQCLVVASGAIAAYWLARDITKSETWAGALAVAYLLQPTLSSGVLFDFHLELFSVPLALFALLGLRRNRPWFWPCMLLSWCFYEINAALFFFAGVGLLVRPGRRKTGGLMALLSLAYLSVLFFVVMAHFRGNIAIPHWDRYAHLGSTPAQAALALLTHPLQSLAKAITGEELRQLRYLFLAFAYLPFLSLKHFLPAVPLLLALVLSNLGLSSDVRFGYFAPVLPFLFLSAAHGAAALNNNRWLQRWRPSILGPVILLACSVSLFADFQIKRPLRLDPFRIRPNLAELREAGKLIPPAAGLSADNHLGAHFADRDILLVTPAIRHRSRFVEFVLTDLNETEFKDSPWWESMRKLVSGSKYGPVFLTNDVLLLQRGITNEPLARAASERISSQLETSLQREQKAQK
jgi:uncharacterized membrane protein